MAANEVVGMPMIGMIGKNSLEMSGRKVIISHESTKQWRVSLRVSWRPCTEEIGELQHPNSNIPPTNSLSSLEVRPPSPALGCQQSPAVSHLHEAVVTGFLFSLQLKEKWTRMGRQSRTIILLYSDLILRTGLNA